MKLTQIFSKRLSRKVWRFDVTISGQRFRESGFNTKAEAEAAALKLQFSARRAKSGLVAEVPPTVRELCDAKIKSIEKRAERVRAERVLNYFANLLPRDQRVDRLTSLDLREFVSARQSDGLKASSINRELNIIAAMLHAAGEFFPSLSQWICPKIPRPKVSQRRRERLISPDELSSLLDFLRAPRKLGELDHEYDARLRVGAVLTFASLTGMRHGEIVKLKWLDVDFNLRRIRARGSKTDKDRYLPITEEIEEIISERRKKCAPDAIYVFSGGGNITPKFYKILRRACDFCGIKYGRNIEGGLVLHDSRHTFVTELLQAGYDMSTVQELSGHQSKHLLMYYAHATDASTRSAMQQISDSHRQKLDKKEKRRHVS